MYNFSRENLADLYLLNTRITVGTNILVLLSNLTWSFEIVYVQIKKKKKWFGTTYFPRDEGTKKR